MAQRRRATIAVPGAPGTGPHCVVGCGRNGPKRERLNISFKDGRIVNTRRMCTSIFAGDKRKARASSVACTISR